jgi:hypothetical protein
MPFTLAHPAAVLPLTRRGLVPSALVVGSMAPDFGYFITLRESRLFSHSLPGVFLLGIPAGFIVLWIFHAILKRPLLSLLTDSHQQRLAPFMTRFRFFPLRRFLWIALSLLIGSLTHLAWDSFTHEDGWMVEQVPIFSTVIFTLLGTNFQVYKLLQYFCSVFGLGILVLWYWRWYQKADLQPVNPAASLPGFARQWIVGLMLLGAFGLACIFVAWKGPEIDSFYSLRIFVVRMIVSGISSLWIEALVYSLFWRGLGLRIAKN